MQEFESISASSYDPSALATKLTAKAAEGWNVVAIVPTGGDVTAFLSRDSDGGKAEPAAEPKSAAAPAEAIVEKEEAKVEPAPMPEVESKPEPVVEPAGWAVAPEPTSPKLEPTIAPTIPSQPAAVTPGAAAAAAAAAQPTVAAQPAAVQPAAVAPARPEPAPTPTPSVPAGWYADPAGRYELRYWDGSTWTEHVSRSGQQFTDPPVA
jgi:hypothetical protein